MGKKKITLELKGMILSFLELNWSISQIIKKILKNGVDISRRTISRIKGAQFQQNQPKKSGKKWVDQNFSK